jgi:uncharacterized protein (TIGR03435 family)
LLLLGGSAAWAQKPSFEVASVKPAAPQDVGKMMIRMGGDPGRVDYKSVPLRMLIANAYNIKDYQINGPDWLASTMFDVEARVAPDTTPENRRLMMQTLLEERFGLKVHMESKELPILSLIVGKNGPKMQKAEDTPPPTDGDGPGGGGGGAPKLPPPDASPKQMAEAMKGGRAGMMMMRMSHGGKLNLNAKTSMSQFAEMLSRQLRRPVIDNTGLAGNYNIELEYKPEPGMGAFMGGEKAAAMAHADVAGGRGPGGEPEMASDGEAGSIYTAIQEQLGLKLDTKKGPVEIVVVDRCEKAPTEN